VTRFDRLEFDPLEPTPAAWTPEAAPEHDERHWMKCADDERRQGHFENALRNYSRALELNRTLTGGWVGQVQMLVALGEYVEAELWARKALELFRNNGDLIAGRAHALARLGNVTDALPLSDLSFKQEGLGAYRWLVRGEIMVLRRESVDAHCFDKAVQLDPDWLVLIEIAQIYRHHRRPAKALPPARKAVERAPTSAYCWYVQGLCERDMGIYAAAKRSFAQCLDVSPAYVEAKRALEALEAEKSSLTGRLKRLFRMR
jgi:tetratricopeptide (TPR) repeat protein